MSIIWWVLIIIVIAFLLIAVLGVFGAFYSFAHMKDNLNNEMAKKARILRIKKMIDYDFGNDYIELINEKRFHPDMPVTVILEFGEEVFMDLINYVDSQPLEKGWKKNPDKITLKNPEADIEKGNYFIEDIDLIYSSNRLKYCFTGC